MLDYLYIIPCAMIAIILHELAHALVSTWLGDPTPKEQGRLTLNPVKHFDLIGLLCLIFFRIGWAKPVRIDSRYYKNQKWGTALVALAGPVMNFLIAIIAIFISVIFAKRIDNKVYEIFFNLFSYLAIISIGLGVFNLIPIPPLDGSRIFGAFLPDEAYYRYMSYERYGMFIILGLLLLSDVITNLLGNGTSLLSNVMYQIYLFLANLIYSLF